MIGSSNKAAWLLLLSVGVASAAPAAVPHPTAPALEDRVMDSDGDAQDAAPTAVEPADNEVVTVQPRGTIRETSVTAPPIEGFGTLEQGKGALPEDIWAGSSRDSADALLESIHGNVLNPTLQTLLLNLLMTQATPPQGNGTQSWFALRVNTLIAMGADDKADLMINSLPASMKSPSLAKLQAGLMLSRGEYDNACKQIQPDALPVDTDGDGFWRKLSILCQAHAGKQEEATVGIDIMREERHKDDPFFQDAIRKIGDSSYAIKSTPKQWSPVDVAALRLAGDTERLKSSMDAFPAVSVKYIARDSSLDIKLREKALARAQQLGAAAPENSKTPEQPFAHSLASDVTTLVTALGSGKPANDADRAVIARLALDDAVIQDSRRVQRLLTLMEPFGYTVPPDVWRKLFAHKERFDGELPPAVLVSRITEAAQAHRRGEVIVLAALIAGNADADRINDLALLPVIKALMISGFEKEARDMAYQAVKGYSAR